MADVSPMPGIRYAAENELAALISPPYDVVSAEEQAKYEQRHPENIIRLELPREEPGDDTLNNRYTRAAELFALWRLNGVLRQDAPSLYLYEVRFQVNGETFSRLTLFARVRLEPWEAGVILPHERTLAKPKDDRLRLTRACAATLSPIMALYDDPKGDIAALLAAVRQGEPRASFTDESGEEHRLWVTDDAALAGQLAALFAPRQLYIADGHHRYETALAYRDEVLEMRKELDPDDALNFTMIGLSAVEDPGLLVLPTHRIVRDVDPEQVASLAERIGTHFDVSALDGDASTWPAALAEAGAGGQTAFVLITPAGAQLLRLKPEGAAAMDDVQGDDAGTSKAWRALDVAILHELVLREGLGITADAIRGGQYVTYTRDAEAAAAAVNEGASTAFLLNPTPPAAIRDVAQAGERMPQKSTYFYPKLPTGLVINPLW